MCVKDEEDIILKCLNAWDRLGATHFFVRDNGSTDGTIAKIKVFQKWCFTMGKTFCLECKRPTKWDNHETINRFVRQAQLHGVSWMFPADADEILHTRHGYDLQRLFDEYTQPAYGELPYYDNVPNGTRRENTHRKVFGHFPKGCDPQISIGNHMVLGTGMVEIKHDLHYEHYPVRSFEQYKTKLLNISRMFEGTDFARAPHYEAYKQEGDAYIIRLYDLGITENIWA